MHFFLGGGPYFDRSIRRSYLHCREIWHCNSSLSASGKVLATESEAKKEKGSTSSGFLEFFLVGLPFNIFQPWATKWGRYIIESLFFNFSGILTEPSNHPLQFYSLLGADLEKPQVEVLLVGSLI